MKDPGLVCMGGFVVFAYFIYMYIGPGGDGVIFGSVLVVLGAIAGIKVGKAIEQTKALSAISAEAASESQES